MNNTDRERIVKIMMMSSGGKIDLSKKKDKLKDEKIIGEEEVTHNIKPNGPEPEPEPENDDPGNDGPGNDGPGNDGPGNDDPGNDGPGNDGPGNDDYGNDDSGFNLRGLIPEIVKRKKLTYNKELEETHDGKVEKNEGESDDKSDDKSDDDKNLQSFTKDKSKDTDDSEKSDKNVSKKKSRTIKRKKIFFHVKDIPVRNKMSKTKYIPNTPIKRRTESFVPSHKEKLNISKRNTKRNTKREYKLNDIGEEKLRESRYKFLKGIEL